jgi:geranylgeranyl pyrophosphate synthase
LEGKRTLILIHALQSASEEERKWMANFLGRPRERRLPRETLQLHDILTKTGSIEWARQKANEFAQAAMKEFDAAFAGAPESPDLDFLRSLIDYLVRRDV